MSNEVHLKISFSIKNTIAEFYTHTHTHTQTGALYTYDQYFIVAITNLRAWGLTGGYRQEGGYGGS